MSVVMKHRVLLQFSPNKARRLKFCFFFFSETFVGGWVRTPPPGVFGNDCTGQIAAARNGFFLCARPEPGPLWRRLWPIYRPAVTDDLVGDMANKWAYRMAVLCDN